MKTELKNKLQFSTDAFLPVDQRVSHVKKCAKLGRLVSLQSSDITRNILYSKFKSA